MNGAGTCLTGEAMIVAITGGTGFIGRKLVARHLANGDQVRLLTRQPNANALWRDGDLQLIIGDLQGSQESEAALVQLVDGADILYHCAGEVRDPTRMKRVHVDGTARLLEAAIGRIGRWVQLSSVGVYGPQSSGVVTEATPWNPAGIYEETKADSDRLVISAGEGKSLRYVILRPSIVFGAGMTNQSLRQMVMMIDRGWFYFVGDPGASANYLHVDNVVEALIQCGVQPNAVDRIYNISDWRSIEDFVGSIAVASFKHAPTRRVPELPLRLVVQLVGRIPRFPLTRGRIDALTNRSRYSTELIEHELDYHHVVSVEEGLHEIVKLVLTS